MFWKVNRLPDGQVTAEVLFAAGFDLVPEEPKATPTARPIANNGATLANPRVTFATIRRAILPADELSECASEPTSADTFLPTTTSPTDPKIRFRQTRHRKDTVAAGYSPVNIGVRMETRAVPCLSRLKRAIIRYG